MRNKALVVLSGGQDSTTCLAWAIENFDKVETITFDYGQRHEIEIESARRVARLAGVSNVVVPVSGLTGSALLEKDSDISITHSRNKTLPASFVPGRNMLFLTLAGAYAYQKDISNIITGVCQTDFSGYPDCRDNTIKSINVSLNLAMDYNFQIHTPLMWLTKAEEVAMMYNLGYLSWLAHTHTCYEGKRPACGKCPACELRLKGFQEVGIPDPLEYEFYPEWYTQQVD